MNALPPFYVMNKIASYEQAAISGGYVGVQAIRGKMDAAVANAWTSVKNWASAAKFDAVSLWDNGIDTGMDCVEDGLAQLPGALQALRSEAKSWGMAKDVKLGQDSVQLYNYLTNTPGTRIAHDAAYMLTSDAPMIALAIGTDGIGEAGDVADGATTAWTLDCTPSELARSW